MQRYIITHKEFDESKFENDYTILTNKKDLKFNHNVQYFEGLDDRLWSEIAAYKGLVDELAKKETYENSTPVEWIQFNHYRRKLDRDICNRIAVAQPVVLPCSLIQHYAQCHNVEDLQVMVEVVKDKCPTMLPSLERALNGNILVPYTIGTFHYNQLKDYVNFLYTILDETLKRMNISTYEQMLEKVKTKAYKKKLDSRPEYQARLVSFLAERLATAYIFRLSEVGQPVFPTKVELMEEGQSI